MQFRIQLMRHASAVISESYKDFDRPLDEAGKLAIDVIGEKLQPHSSKPDIICSSPALRAKQTALGISPYLQYSPQAIRWEPDLYLASLENLLLLLAQWSQAEQTILLVGHNPGLQQLFDHLTGGDGHGKIFHTAAFAELVIDRAAGDLTCEPNAWPDSSYGSARLQWFDWP